MRTYSTILILSAATIGLVACSAVPAKKSEQFWQRKSMSEAIYAQGPKAQQLLDRDIADCVTELRELERLHHTKNAIPTDFAGRVLDPDENALADWDAPERDGALLAEHSNYMDFESCMGEKGWERIAHVPFEVAARGRENYKRAKYDYDPLDNYSDEKAKKRSLTSQEVGDYAEVNE